MVAFRHLSSIVIAIALLCLCLHVADAKNVHVVLNAQWSETSFAAEACEAVAASTKGTNAFFDCITLLSSSAVNPHGMEATPQQQYETARVALEQMPALAESEHTKALIQTELATRVYSPKVEAHRQLALQHQASCSSLFAVVSTGEVYCDISQAISFAQQNNNCDRHNVSVTEFSDVEHVMQPASDDACRKVILYAVIGHRGIADAHRLLVDAGAAIRYLFRHSASAAEGGAYDSGLVGLQGYSVTLDVKNMEYKAVDEKKQPEEGSKKKGKKGSGKKDDADSAALAEDDVIAGFDIAKLKKRKPSLQVGLSDFAAEIAERAGKEQEDVQLDLQIWELQQLGFQTAMHILKSKQPMDVLEDILSNFPLRAAKLSKLSYSASAMRTLQQQLSPLQRMFGDGSNALFLNGRGVADNKFDFYSLLQELRKDDAFFNDLERVILFHGGKNESVPPASAQSLNYYLNRLKNCQLQKSERREKPKRFAVDQNRVLWLTDLRTSPLFADAGTSVTDIMRNNYYGQPLFPKKNIFHAVYLIDPSSREGLEALSVVHRLLSTGSAARIGICLVDRSFSPHDERHFYTTAFSVDGVVHDSDAPAILRPTVAAMIQAVVQELSDDPKQLMDFLMDLFRAAVKEEITEESVRATAPSYLPYSTSIDSLLTSPAFYEHYRDHNRYFKSIGIRNFPVMLFNGLLYQENLQNAFFQGFQQEFQVVRDMVLRSELTDAVEDIYEFFMTLHGAIKRYQPAIYDKVSYLPFKSRDHVRFIETRPFIRSKEFDGQASLISHVLMLPGVPTYDSIVMLDRGLQHLQECTVCMGVQLTISTCSASRGAHVYTHPLNRILEGTYLGLSASIVNESQRIAPMRLVTGAILDFVKAHFTPKQVMHLTFDEETTHAVVEHLKALSTLPAQTKQAIFNVNIISPANAEVDIAFCNAMLDVDAKLTGRVPFILTNGRITVYDDTFLTDDFMLLEMEEGPRTQNVYSCMETDQIAVVSGSLTEEEITKQFIATKLAVINSIIYHDHVTYGPRMEKVYLPYPTTPYSFNVNKSLNPLNARHTLNVVLNPVARESQPLVSLVKYFSSLERLGISCVVYLNPPGEMQKIPIHNFYQMVLLREPQFDSRGSVVAPSAYFRNVPQSVTLTMGLVEPEAWMVFASSAPLDLDNIRLQTLVGSSTLRVEYTLQHILLTGSCHDLTTDSKPRGLPIVMTKKPGMVTRGEGATDTLVMSNYGYFQLQGNPGVWHLSIQSGIPSDIYEIVDVEEKDSSSVWSAYQHQKRKSSSDVDTAAQRRQVAIVSFTGKHVNLRVQKREGKERLDFLQALKNDDQDENVWPPAGPQAVRPSKPTLNIFSVASGHLYERFLRIMFHTVMKTSSDVHGANTTRIKFWLIENFLSPTFKEFVPKMAEKYGFDYGFVTYRWPHWLRRQTEKQRTIWGYKILFLDVLFPLDVDKVLFVDADQIVQSDLHELYNMDLNGRAMAYTPFCRQNRNEETKGFRFWEQGFWSDHLQGKPYHISAIYVVDLKRLRQMGGGDQYRTVYDNLSADPNSLANLDQDLPNFAQHQVPIFSLPEEWLWCETWCNQESKARAKTIDLCNNPLTKTPKLENAKRIIPEWEEMDAALDKLVEQH